MKRRRGTWTACLLLVAMLLFLAWHGHERRAQAAAALARALAPNRARAQLEAATAAAPAQPRAVAAPEQVARRAKALEARAWDAVAHAHCYHLRMTSELGPHQLAVFDLEYLRSATRGDLLIGRRINYQGNPLVAAPGGARTEMSDDRGNWLLTDLPGQEDLAFVSSSEGWGTDQTLALHRGALQQAALRPPDLKDYDYEISGGAGDHPAVLVVSEIGHGANAGSNRYCIDANTGALISYACTYPGGGWIMEYQLDLDIPEGDFDVIRGRIVTSVASLSLADKYLEDSP